MNSQIFKAYDIRGIYPSEISETDINSIAQAYLKFLSQKTGKPIKDLQMVVCRDVRLSSKPIADEAIKVFLQFGVSVHDLGEQSINDYYFAVGRYKYDGGFMATASHNPPQYGGCKLAYYNLEHASSIEYCSGKELYQFMQSLELPLSDEQIPGKLEQKDISSEHLSHIMSFVDKRKVRPLKVVVDTGNGMNALMMPKIFHELPCELIHLFPELDGTYPNRPPNPLTAGASDKLAAKIKEVGADIGFICDVDGDRINILDEKGQFYRGDMTLLPMVKAILAKNPGAGIVYNVICSHAVKDLIKEWGGRPIRSEVGYLNLARHMRQEQGIMSGEVSAHFAFRDNYYADSAFIALALALEAISQDGRPVSEIMRSYTLYFKSEELNFVVDSVNTQLDKFQKKYQANLWDEMDGLTFEFDNWWFNIRPSNTEPLLRLTIEANSAEILAEKIKELESLIDFKERKQ